MEPKSHVRLDEGSTLAAVLVENRCHSHVCDKKNRKRASFKKTCLQSIFYFERQLFDEINIVLFLFQRISKHYFAPRPLRKSMLDAK